MKYAVIGTGKTGQVILDALPPKDVVAVCNSRNLPTQDKLRSADVGIVFVPGAAFENLMPLFLEIKLPLVIGVTGYVWPENLDQELKAAGIAWIIGQNFSLGLNVMRFYAQRVSQTMTALREGDLQLGLEETHHIHKIDAPSGTALYIAKALHFPVKDIKSWRLGEIKGQHKVSFDWPHERLTLIHDAFERSIYAEGVLLACQKLATLSSGLHNFEKIADTLIETAAARKK